MNKIEVFICDLTVFFQVHLVIYMILKHKQTILSFLPVFQFVRADLRNNNEKRKGSKLIYTLILEFQRDFHKESRLGTARKYLPSQYILVSYKTILFFYS